MSNVACLPQAGMLINMKRIIHILLIIPIIATAIISSGNAQSKVIDRVVAVVGDNIILQSDVENLYLQYRAQDITTTGDMKCMILEEFLSQKLLLNQARIDSIEVSDTQVELELEGRLQMFINQIGSREKLENYFNKSVLEIKEDLCESIYEQIVTRQMQAEITGNVKVTPSEVKQFYNRLPEDSIPYIDSEIEISQIVLYPPVKDEAIIEVKQRLLDLRKRILEGENFITLAVLYSEDASSAPRGGEIGFMSRGELDPEYAKAAFSLKKGGISTIVESSFGFHIIQLIDRQEERVNTRHILMKPKTDPDAVERTIYRLDSLANLIRKDSLRFETAARYFSQDKKTSVNGGIMINPVNNTTRFEMDELLTNEYYAIKDLKDGEISDPAKSYDENGKQVFKIIKINNRTKPHKANIQEDYVVLQNMTLAEKRDRVFNEWLQEKILSTYIQIDGSFKGCTFSNNGWFKE